MYALFLESVAADEVRGYAEHHAGVDVDELLKLAYQRTKGAFLAKNWVPNYGPYTEEEEQRFNDFWVMKCLNDDSHKTWDIDSCFCWGDTPEGHDFWEAISQRDHNAGW